MANYASGFTSTKLFEVNWYHIFVGKLFDFLSVIVDASVPNHFSQEKFDEYIYPTEIGIYCVCYKTITNIGIHGWFYNIN